MRLEGAWIGALEKLRLKPPEVLSHENTRTPDTVHWTDTYRVESGKTRINAQRNERKTSDQITPKGTNTLHLDEYTQHLKLHLFNVQNRVA